MAKFILMCMLSMLACASAQRITTIHLDGVQYFISRMNPYSPELNYFLAYQYCRSLGLQLASFETKEKAESMTTYLKNAGYGNYDFWTSGNRLGTGMFLWMSTGLPFNATFDLFENSGDALQTSMLDANDHNSNTAPQRTARDSSSGSEKGCVILKQPSLKWMPEDCSAVKDFICEQTRCYYYNYGSIPVSSAQGRPITSTTPQPQPQAQPKTQSQAQQQQFTTSSVKAAQFTTPLPVLLSTHATENKFTHSNQKQNDNAEDESQPSFMSLNLNQDPKKLEHEDDTDELVDSSVQDGEESKEDSHEFKKPDNLNTLSLETKEEESNSGSEQEQSLDSLSTDDQDEQENVGSEVEPTENALKFIDNNKSSADNSPEVDERVKQISHKIESIVNSKEQQQKIAYQHPTQKHFNREEHNERDDDDLNRQSFLSLTDLIRTLRPHDKQIIPQIDSDYSNAMRVLGENTGPLIKNNDNEHQRGGLNFRDM